MKKNTLMALTLTVLSAQAFANGGGTVGSSGDKLADAICRKEAVSSARAILKTKKSLYVSMQTSDVREISTPIAYEFRFSNSPDAEVMATVQAYAYTDTRSCTLGTVVNLMAGND